MRAIVGLMLWGWAFAASAQGTGTVAGKVLDAASGKGLPGAVVAGAGKSATSGADGAYRLEGLAPGNHTFTATLRGYVTETRPGVKVAAGATTTLELRLKASKPAEAQPKQDVAHKGKRAESAGTRGGEVDSLLSGASGAPAARAPLGTVGGGYGQGAGRGSGAMAPPRVRHPAPRPVASMPAGPRPAQIAVGEPAPQEEANREGYDAIKENPFLAVREQALSTFSIDVDTASYANVRRFIEQGQLPPRDAVRIEELINYFPYRYAEPTGEHPFSVETEVADAPWNPAHRLLRIGLQARRVDTAKLPASNLVFLIDVSGSMNAPDKLPLLKNAFKLLVNNLRKQDRVAIVVYAGAAGLVLPSTPGGEKGAILAALDRLSAGGSTAGGAGIRLAYEVAKQNFAKGGNNRVILATDGDFNVGASSDSDMVQLIEEKRKEGVFLTVLGFGRGNYQDAKMQKIADAGNGNHGYIDSLLEAKKVLVTEMGGTLLTVAKDVKIQIEFNPAKVKGYRLIGYENRLLRNQDFNDDTKDAGEMGAGHSVTALYELIPADSKEAIPGVDPLKYQTTEVSEAAKSGELATVKLRYKAPQGDTSKLLSQPVNDASGGPSADFRFASAVAELGLLLRDSEHKGKASFDALIKRARGATTPENDPEGYRYDFVKLAEKAQLLRSASVAR